MRSGGLIRLPPGHGAGPEVVGRPLRDQGTAAGAVVLRQQVIERHVRVAVVRLPVRERELLRLQDGVRPQLGGRIKVPVLEPGQDGQGLQQRRPLAPRPGLGDRVAPELHGGGRLIPGFESRQIVQGEHSAVIRARGMPVRGLNRLHHGAGHEPLPPLAPGRINSRLAGGCPDSGLHEPFQRAGIGRVPHQLALGRDSAARHPQLSRRGPVRLEQRGHGRDGGSDPAEHRVAVPRVADREVQHRVQLPRSVVTQQQEPGVDGGRHRGGQGTRARNEVQAFGHVVLHGGPGRRRALPHQDYGLLRPVRGDEDPGHVPAGPVEVRLHHMEHERSRHRGVEGVAAALQARPGPPPSQASAWTRSSRTCPAAWGGW